MQTERPEAQMKSLQNPDTETAYNNKLWIYRRQRRDGSSFDSSGLNKQLRSSH